MKILFDACCPQPLRKHFPEHEVTTAQEMGWRELRNGELLAKAQALFDVMISTDSNIEYQQRLPDYEIGLIVLRSVTGKVSELATLMPQCHQALQIIQSSQCLYLFTDKAWDRERRKGKVKPRWLPSS